MKFTKVQHIFFDLDHTLWDFDKNSELAFTSIFKKNRIEIEVSKFIEKYTPINAHYWKLYREDKVSKPALRYGRLKETFDLLEINVSDDQIDQLAIDYIEFLPNNNHLLEGTIEILDYLHPRYNLHIITNGFKEVQHRKMESSGILKYFNTITTSEDVGVKKPHRQIFEVALQNASANVEESIMIGDNLEADVLGAQNLGMPAILYNYYGEEISGEFHQVLKMKDLTKYF